MSEKIYIIGHKSPDLDSIAAAISYADFKNKQEKTDRYVPARAGEINKATAFILGKFGFEIPELIDDAQGKSLILVDHNEFAQAVSGIEEAVIVEILDHHKMNFAYGEPIRVDIQPIGSSNSLVYGKYLEAGIEFDQNLAGLMLSAVLDDTVITKSPTCTDEDKKIIAALSAKAGIGDWNGFGIRLFKEKSSFGAMTELEIIKSDFKDFPMKAGKIGIGQVETVDLADFESREDALLEELQKLKSSGGYHSAVLFITDIINVGSRFLLVSEEAEKIEQALGKSFENSRTYVEGMVSRKKQVAPLFAKLFD